MCTVTFIPLNNHYYLTSNRDEHNTRGQAIAPKKIQVNGFEILYPKDADAGGTWIATKNTGEAIVLLNGGFCKHQPNPPYKKSRGLILLNIFTEIDPLQTLENEDLTDIEPFTLVYFGNLLLTEFRWDGLIKHFKELNSSMPHIWSSVTLYEPVTIKKRQNWFNEWQLSNSNPELKDILNFHLNAGEGDTEIDINMNRNNELFTVSVSSIYISEKENEFTYIDLINNKSYKESLLINSNNYQLS
jgi:hypothetical protein